MTDNLSPENRKKTMRAVKGKDTRLERRLFSMLARMGFRGWKRNSAQVFGKPDVIFPDERVAIFVDGCFWHGCPHCKRKLPRTNRTYWERKIERNVKLARAHNRRLRKADWTVIRIWEHEMSSKAAMGKIGEKISNAVSSAAQMDVCNV